MKRLSRIASGTIVAGLSALTASCAMADGWHDGWRDDRASVQVRVNSYPDHRDSHWNDWRGWHRERERTVVVRPAPVCSPPPVVVVAPPPVCVLPDVDYNVAFSRVPAVVMQQAECERSGAVIESVQFVRRNGEEFYRFILDAGFGRHLNMRIMPGGRLLGIDPC